MEKKNPKGLRLWCPAMGKLGPSLQKVKYEGPGPINHPCLASHTPDTGQLDGHLIGASCVYRGQISRLPLPAEVQVADNGLKPLGAVLLGHSDTELQTLGDLLASLS